MLPRIIISRDVRNKWRAYGDGDESQRPEIAAEIHRIAETIAIHWVQHTKSQGMIMTPVALKTLRRKAIRKIGYVEIAWMSAPQLLYPLSGNYSFGIDASGALYDQVYRRNLSFTEDVRYWVPMKDVAESSYSTAVLSQYLLPYLNNMALH